MLENEGMETGLPAHAGTGFHNFSRNEEGDGVGEVGLGDETDLVMSWYSIISGSSLISLRS